MLPTPAHAAAEPREADVLAVASALGRAIGAASDPDFFARELALAKRVHPELAFDIASLRATLLALDGTASFYDYVAREVWRWPARTAFFLEGPLDALVLRTREADGASLDGRAFDLLRDAVAHGADVARLACGFVGPGVGKLAERTGHVDALVALLSELARDGVAREMLAEPELARALARRARSRAHTAEIVGFLDALEDPLDVAFEPFVDQCARLLVGEFVRVHALHEPDERHLRAALALLARVGAQREWRPRLVPAALALARHGWPHSFGHLAAALLCGHTSVELVVRFEREGKLARLVRAAHEHRGHAWRRARLALHAAWPAKTTEYAGDVAGAAEARRARGAAARGDDKNDDATEVDEPSETDARCCPITLAPCERPVVASDGHVYERDALLRHMCVTGATSPMTRETLEWHLYPLRGQ
jgi:hypothetical protein